MGRIASTNRNSSRSADAAAMLAEDARACRHCAAHLPHEPRPVLRIDQRASLLIIGQAPGRRVHETGIPWNDPSGRRLRAWMDVDDATFYDGQRVAIVPMGLCYPGTVDGADLPPRPECAPLWHPRVRAVLPRVKLTLLVGGYAQAYYLPEAKGETMTGRVQDFRRHLPDFLPLPHPSWRNSGWIRRHPWFETELLPELRRRVHAILG